LKVNPQESAPLKFSRRPRKHRLCQIHADEPRRAPNVADRFKQDRRGAGGDIKDVLVPSNVCKLNKLPGEVAEKRRADGVVRRRSLGEDFNCARSPCVHRTNLSRSEALWQQRPKAVAFPIKGDTPVPPADNQPMNLGDRCARFGRVARWTRSRQLATCGVALVVTAINVGCGASSHAEAPSAEDAVVAVRQAAKVAPKTPGWNWPEMPTSFSPYTKDKGRDPPPTPDPLTAKLYRQLRGLDLIGSAGSRWQNESKLAHLVVEQWSSTADAHAAMPAYREYAHGWAKAAGDVSDEVVTDLGDEAWRIWAGGYSEEVTYKWRRENLVIEAHIQCLTTCPSDLDNTARGWVEAIDEEARRPSA